MQFRNEIYPAIRKPQQVSIHVTVNIFTIHKISYFWKISWIVLIMYEPGKVKEIKGNIFRYKFILEQGDTIFWVISEWIVDISDDL